MLHKTVIEVSQLYLLVPIMFGFCFPVKAIATFQAGMKRSLEQAGKFATRVGTVVVGYCNSVFSLLLGRGSKEENHAAAKNNHCFHC